MEREREKKDLVVDLFEAFQLFSSLKLGLIKFAQATVANYRLKVELQKPHKKYVDQYIQ